MHLHNAYAFNFSGRTEIFVAVLGNPWRGPLPGKGLVQFDRATETFKLDTTAGPELNGRSAKQQADGAIFVLTQEPSGQQTKLARLEEKSGHLAVVAVTSLPALSSPGDGGADVLLGVERDTVWVTDRQGNAPGRLYYYVYSGNEFTQMSERETGVHPRYAVATESGDIVVCNRDDSTLSVYESLALQPTNTSISERRIPTLNGPMFFMQLNESLDCGIIP